MLLQKYSYISVLEGSDDLRKRKYRGDKNIYKGFCYISCEVLFFLAARKNIVLKPYVMRVENDTHWFLKDLKGKVIDPTAKQFDYKLDYNGGRCCGFLTKTPSKRAKELAKRLGVKI